MQVRWIIDMWYTVSIVNNNSYVHIKMNSDLPNSRATTKMVLISIKNTRHLSLPIVHASINYNSALQLYLILNNKHIFWMKTLKRLFQRFNWFDLGMCKLEDEFLLLCIRLSTKKNTLFYTAIQEPIFVSLSRHIMWNKNNHLKLLPGFFRWRTSLGT